MIARDTLAQKSVRKKPSQIVMAVFVSTQERRLILLE